MACMAVRVHRATTKPGECRPRSRGASIRQATGATMCLRPAPIERRTAISVDRAGSAHQKQVRDVRAADQQHERGHAEQERERTTGLVRCAALALRAGLELHLPCSLKRSRLDGLMPCCKRHVDRRMDRPVLPVEDRARLLARDAGLEPREEVRPVRTTVVEPLPPRHDVLAHRDRHVDSRPFARTSYRESPAARRRRSSSAGRSPAPSGRSTSDRAPNRRCQ